MIQDYQRNCHCIDDRLCVVASFAHVLQRPLQFADIDELEHRAINAMVRCPVRAYAQQMALNPTSDPVALRSRVEHNLRERPDGTLVWKYDPALRNGTARYENLARDDQWAFWHALTVPTLAYRCRVPERKGRSC